MSSIYHLQYQTRIVSVLTLRRVAPIVSYAPFNIVCNIISFMLKDINYMMHETQNTTQNMAKYFNLAYGQYFFPSLGYVLYWDFTVIFTDIYKTWEFIWMLNSIINYYSKEHMVA